jgi:hypothetical protein
VNGPPPGWRYPAERSYSFHLRADFNGDGILDEASILLSEKGPGWGVFVFLGAKDGHMRVTSLETEPGTLSARDFGIRIAEPGVYETACGKGYFDCNPSEPTMLKLQHPAIDLFQNEGANSFFWWDAATGQFRRTWMSD